MRSGDKAPADLVLFASTELKVDNSSLTGEAEPQTRSVSNSQRNPLEATNLVFNGSLAVNGEGYGIVIRVGDNTVIGQIAFLTSSEEKRISPMSQEINEFVRIVGTFAAIVTITFFLVARFVRSLSWAGSFNFAIGTFTAFVPQGLPALVTILLSLAAARMAKQNVLVKDLQGVETLGAITLLATDKTGTLTKNQMTVSLVWSGLKLYNSESLPELENKGKGSDIGHEWVLEILFMSILCSRARFGQEGGPMSTRPIIGDATEAGLLRNAAQKLENYDKLHEMYPKVFEIPFNSENKWAMTIHKKTHPNGNFVIYVKGAPERVLALCSSIHDGTGVVPLTDFHKREYETKYSLMASKGHRVLAFAALMLPSEQFPSSFEFQRDPPNFPLVRFFFLNYRMD